jgi:hypothetical protein
MNEAIESVEQQIAEIVYFSHTTFDEAYGMSSNQRVRLIKTISKHMKESSGDDKEYF